MSTPAAATTPPRNNYAAPHTPIASAKRPRSSLERGASARRLPPMMKSPAPKQETPKSPMHPPRAVPKDVDPNATLTESNNSGSWVGRQVDALFSPVLSFLGNSQDELDHSHDNDIEDDAPVCITDEENVEVPPVMASTETTHDDDEEEEEEEELQQQQQQDSYSYEEEEEEFNPYLFIKSLPRYESVQHLRPPIALPPKELDAPPISLVLDLDETLVHCTIEPIAKADLSFPVVFHGTEYQVHVRLRPHLHEFLQKIKGKYEVIVFTASQQVYADQLLNRIDPDGKYIQHRMFRESCLAVEGNYLKDLHVLGRDLTKTVLVDNSPHAFGYQVDNGIPIESWFDDPHDLELLKLAEFLETLSPHQSVKEAVRAKFQTWKLVQEAH